ncbi:MAG: hypothetical protein HeimC3_10420 [Candidatus Heimdallarchaeota archaeon LC_3]|nr:MAG: hypothetical protein HeimC3_10420 [Candidatus Heimdallarchaeota archaeon LC_3]
MSSSIDTYQKIVNNLKTLDPRNPVIGVFENLSEFNSKIIKKRNELEKTGGLFSGGKKKKIQLEIDDLQKKFNTYESKLLNQLNEYYKNIYNDLMNNLKVIAAVAPNHVDGIKVINAPLGMMDSNKVCSFSSDVHTKYTSLLDTLKEDTWEILTTNKDILERYRRYVEIPREEVTSTSRTTLQSLNLMSLAEILAEKDLLLKERNFLEKRAEDVQREVRLSSTDLITKLRKSIDTSRSLGIDVANVSSDNVINLRKRFKEAKYLQGLFDAETELQRLQNEFTNGLRSEINKVKGSIDSEIGRLATVSKETKNLSELPEFNLSTDNMTELIQQVETLRSFEKKILIEMKKLVDISEFNAAIRALDNKKVSIPESMKKEVISIHRQLEKSETLSSTTDLLIKYYNTSSDLTEVIRKKLYEMVENEDLKSVSDMFPPPPQINIETIDPRLLLRQFDEIEGWRKTISTFLQGMASEITKIIESLSKAERYTSLEPEFKKELNGIMNKVVGERDISILVQLRKELESTKERIFSYLFSILNKNLQGTFATRVSLLANSPVLPSSDFKGQTNIISVVDKIEEFNDWKKKVLIFLKDNRPLDQTRVMAETGTFFEVTLPQEYIRRLNQAKEKVQSLSDLDDLLESYIERENLIGELNESIRKRIKTLIDLMSALGMDLIAEIGISMDGDLSALKASVEKIYRWMDNKKTELQQRIDKSRSLLRTLQSRAESGQLPIELPDDMLLLISENGKVLAPKNDVKDLATELQKLSEVQVVATDYIGDKIRKEMKESREQMQLARNLRSNVSFPDLNYPDFTPGNIEGMLNTLAILEEWKVKTSDALIEGLKNFKFPTIPVDTEFDLSNQRQATIEDLKRLLPGQALKRYNQFLQDLDLMREKIVNVNNELKDRIQSVTSRSEALFGQKIEDYSDSKGGRELTDFSYAEGLQEWWNLNSHLQWQKEVLLTYIHNDIGYKLSVLQELAPPHNEFFQNTMSFLFEKSQGAKDKDLEEIIQDYRIVQEKTIEYTEEDYRKFLQGGILPSIRVALPRIREIIQIPSKILEIEENIERSITSQRDFFVIVSSASQLMSFYTEIVNELKIIAKDQSKLMIKELTRIKESGLDLSSYIPPEIKFFASLDEIEKGKKEGEEKKQATIKDTTDAFVAIDRLRSHPEVCVKIRNESINHVKDVRNAIKTVSDLYGLNVEERFPVIQEYISEEFERDISRDNIFTLADLYVSLIQFRNDFILAIRAIEEDQNKRFEEKLEKNLKYYLVVKEIFEVYQNKLESVFPLTKIMNIRKEAMNTTDLSKLTELLPQLREGRNEYEREMHQLNKWHSALVMFISGFSIKEIESVDSDGKDDENVRQFEDIKKKIISTYRSNNKIKTYLVNAAKRFIELESGKPLKTK